MSKKQFLLVLVVAFIGGMIGGALSGKVFTQGEAFAKGQKVIEANVLKLLDHDGKLGAVCSWNGIQFFDEKEDEKLDLTKQGLVFTRFDSESKIKEQSYFSPYKGIRISTPHGFFSVSGSSAFPWGIRIHEKHQVNKINIVIEDGEPSVRVGNPTGRGTIIGYAKIKAKKSGEEITKSASSITMVDDDSKVIWSAP